MSLVKRAEAFLRNAAMKREEAVSRSHADALADLIVAYEERMAMVLEGGDISEAEAHQIATAECGATIAELRQRLTALAPDHEVFACICTPTARKT